MKHWRIEDVAWERFSADKVEPTAVKLVKSAALVERNASDYAVYLNNVFHDDPDFGHAANRWSLEEMQHGDALGRWAGLADPGWDYPAAFARFCAGYRLPLEAARSVRGSRTGELIARCMVETGTSSYYTALGEATAEPVLQQVCRLIAADEFRHFKLFYDHMRRWLERERIGLPRRLRIAAGRIGETEDDELAYAWYCANEPAALPYDRRRCVAAYREHAVAVYRLRHVERSMGMIFKTVGLPPRGLLPTAAARLSWQLLHLRQRRITRSARTGHR